VQLAVSLGVGVAVEVSGPAVTFEPLAPSGEPLTLTVALPPSAELAGEAGCPPAE